MKRKIISLLLLVTLCLNLAVCASAAHYSFVVDFLDVMSEDEVETLDEMASALYEDTGVGVFYVYDTAPNLQEYNYSAWVDDLTDYYIMLENEDSWYFFASGRGVQLDTEALRNAYDAVQTYAEGVEAYLAEAAIQLALDSDGSVSNDPTENDLLVWDDAELLTQAEVSALNAKLESISNKYNAEMRIVTLPTMDGGDIDAFLEFLYDTMRFGYGENHDGVLLLVCMDPREYRILSNGFAGEAITSSDIDTISNAFVSDLSDGNYADAFDTYADECEYYLNGYIAGFPFEFGINLLIAFGVGFLVAAIITAVWKGQLKSVRKQNEASAYVKADSMQITQSGDYFMYRNITKTEKPKNNSSSSSGGGGASRSTGGGSF